MFPDYDFTSNYVHIDGHRLHYLDEGTGPVIVMVHGNPTWSYFYRRLINRLREDFRVIAVDHMGCGRSDKPRKYPYTLQQHISNLQFLLARLEISRYSLVVHDWGGAIGFGCAVDNPGSIEKITLLNTAAFRSTRIPLRIRICRWPFIGPLIVRGLNGFAWPATFMAVSIPLASEVKKAYLAPYDSWANRVAIAAFVKDIPLSPAHRSYGVLEKIENGLSGLRERGIPMLILWGGRDFCFDRHFYEEWRRRFPEARHHYFEDGGHYLLEDKFDEVSALVQSFMNPNGE